MHRYNVGIDHGFTSCLPKLVAFAQNYQHCIQAYHQALIWVQIAMLTSSGGHWQTLTCFGRRGFFDNIHVLVLPTHYLPNSPFTLEPGKENNLGTDLLQRSGIVGTTTIYSI
jgi:hypothetical protein